MIDNVLSLFDGISCGQIALERVGITPKQYFASEIDTQSIKVTQFNYPRTIQLGDVTKLKSSDLPKIDLVIGGSPCQGFSFSGKELNFSDPKSKLFFEYARLINEVRPRYWMLENVVMRKEFEKVITDILGVEPVMIDSSLLCAQKRKRLYWANFPITQPKDMGINLIDILEPVEISGLGIVRPAELRRGTILSRRINDIGVREDYNLSIPRIQYLEVRSTDQNKANCLTTVAKDSVLTTLPIGRHADPFKNKLPFRYYTRNECCRLQTVPLNYFDKSISDNSVRKMLGNGWTVDIIAHIFNCMLQHNKGKL